MASTYTVDTCVFISYPDCLNKIQGNIVIPVVVLEELDKLKSAKENVSHKARQAIRALDEICSKGDPIKGIKLPTGFTFKIDTKSYPAIGEDLSYGDNKLLGMLVKKKTYTLITQDISLRMRAKAHGITVEQFKHEDSSELYSGIKRFPYTAVTDQLLFEGKLDAEELDLRPNEFAYFYDNEGNDIIAAQNTKDGIKMVQKLNYWGIGPKNLEQSCALAALGNNSIPLVSILGEAGSGKTLLTLATALDLVVNQKKYSKVIIFRPIQTFQNELGYMPGNELEKLMPYYGSIMDNLEVLLSGGKRGRDWRATFEMFMEKGIIEFAAMSFIRGRSIPNALVIVDEMQNMDSTAAKVVLTRIGRGSRVFVNGDVKQIDVKNLHEQNTAIYAIANKFKDSHLSAHITLEKCERSELTAAAIELL